MGLNRLVVFAVVAFLASAKVPSVGAESSPNVRFNRVLTDRLKVTEENNDEDEERGKMAEYFAKFSSKLRWRKKKLDPKVLAKVDSKVLSRAESKVLPSVPEKLTTVPKMPNLKEVDTALDDFVNGGKTLDDVFNTQLLGKKKGKELFDPDALPMYLKFSERTASQRGHDEFGVMNLLSNGFFTEKELVQAINHGLTSKNEVNVATAERLRAGLVSKFWTEKKPAVAVATSLKDGKVRMDNANLDIWTLYRDLYNEIHITGKTLA